MNSLLCLTFRRFLVCVCLLSGAAAVDGQNWLTAQQEAIIQYSSSEGLEDPVAKLQKRLVEGKAKLTFEHRRGYLDSLLKALRIPVSSQGLVFSKSSSQAEWTSPKSPRALYFGDDVYVAWVSGAPEIDLIAVDPCRGPIFYTLAQKPESPAAFKRPSDCMRCHTGKRTQWVPGPVVYSLYTGPDGTAMAHVPRFVAGHIPMLSLRWGGWYVTGTHVGASSPKAPIPGGEQAGEFHLGNIFSVDPVQPERIDPSAGANVIDLRNRFDASSYLSAYSDIVALLVLEHEVGMQNLLTRCGYESRFARAESDLLTPGSAQDADINGEASTRPRQRMELAAENLLEYMLFRNEAPLRGPIRGTTRFLTQFERVGPRSAKGRSLRQFDLQIRLFRYPCSYLIYSSAFEALPQPTRHYIWRRLEQILTGQDRGPTYAGMEEGDRKAVLEILRDTKPEFAALMSK
jgi:hypothetical protein